MMMLMYMTVIILYLSTVSRVGLATTGNGRTSIQQAEFGPAPNVTKVQVDSTAFLHCNVLNLQEDNQVSWIRRRDWHIMSVGDTVYTSDDRVVVTHKKQSTDWVLQFKFAKQRDQGVYECQVTMSNGQIKSRSVNLEVVMPEAIILATDEYRIEKGSLISLVCILENALLPPEYVFWYQNDRMINYDTNRGVTVTTIQGKKTSSRLNIQNAQPQHTGNYTCKPSSSTPASIQLFVLDDKTGALTDSSPWTNLHSAIIVIYPILYLISM